MKLVQTQRHELYKDNKVFSKNHVDCREELFYTFHAIREEAGFVNIHVWLEAVRHIEKYFRLQTSAVRKMFYEMAENFFDYNVEPHFEDYPFETSPQFHCDCESFVCWFDLYIKRDELVNSEVQA
ncbi:hypothetical protein ABEX30_20370 [Priestia aryabhattai]|uniref:hypothetical protein n=1 Tax=Priestia aryabhattai TaxID=412384 RepID=UPI003D27BBF4